MTKAEKRALRNRRIMMQDKENFIAALEHWAEFFKSNDDDYADDIAYLLQDKAYDLKMEIENA